MRLLFDHQVFTWQKSGGVSRVMSELISRVNKKDLHSAKLPIRFSDNEYVSKSQLTPEDIEPCFQPFNDFLFGFDFKGKGRLFEAYQTVFQKVKSPYDLNQELVVKELKKGFWDVFMPTYYDNYFLEHLGNKPFVLTVYDMIHEIFPEYNLSETIIKEKKELILRADHIVAISKNTKKDIVDIYNVPKSKVTVAHLATSSNFRVSKEVEGLPKDYLLYVGNRSRYKNFYFIARAVSVLPKSLSHISLLVVGGPLYQEEKDYLKLLGVLDRVMVVSPNDEELAYMYSKAIALLFTSNYEGFGLPIVEAFEAKCPVILSNVSCMPEIGEDAAYYVSPKEIEEIKEAINRLYEDKDLREKLIAKGLERAKKFSWEDYTNKVINIASGLC